MPMINIEDAYILGETGAQVDKVTGLFTKDEDTTRGEKAFAQLNIGTAGSNRNLLDNAYFVGGGSQLGDGIFPINQRGQSSYSSSAVVWFDRWMNGYPQATATLTANGVKLSAAKWLFQPLRKEVYEGLEGETVTASVMFADGTIYSGTNTFTANSDVHFAWVVTGGENLELRTSKYGSAPSFQLVNFSPDAGSEMTVAAFKLEKGTVSTLANDVPPDFGAELAKCQRRLFRVSPMGTASRGYAGFGSANSSKNILAFVPTPVTLAAQPTVSFSNCNAYNYVAGGSIAISSISIDSWTQNGVFLSCTPSDASQVVQYQPYVLRVAQGGYLQFSAPL